MKERGESPNNVGDAVREYRTMHEKNFWSSWLREEERGKEERTARGRSKEDVRVLFRWKPLKSLVKEEIWRAVMTCLGKTSWISLRTCLIVSLFLVSWCVWCLM